MLRLSDFVTYSNEKDIIFRVGGVCISVLEHCRKSKFRTFLHLTLISKMFMSRLSDFVVCTTNLYIWSSESISKVFRSSFEVKIQYVNSSDHINTILKGYHA